MKKGTKKTVATITATGALFAVLAGGSVANNVKAANKTNTVKQAASQKNNIHKKVMHGKFDTAAQGPADITWQNRTNTLIISDGVMPTGQLAQDSADLGPVSPSDIQHIKLVNVTAPTNAKELFRGFTNLQDIQGLNDLDVSNTTSVQGMFWDDPSLSKVEITKGGKWRTNQITDASYMFYEDGGGYVGPSTIDLSGFNTSKVTDMGSMFFNDSNLSNLNLGNMDTSNVTSMFQMFMSDYRLKDLDVSSFNTAKVTNMAYMFCGTGGLIHSTNSAPFSSIKGLKGFKTANVTDMSNMFNGEQSVKSLDLSSFDTSNVTNMDHMFQYDQNLNDLDLSSFDTSNVTNMNMMFANDFGLLSLNLNKFDTSNVNNMTDMFQKSSQIEQLTLGKKAILNPDSALVVPKVGDPIYDEKGNQEGTVTQSNWMNMHNITDTVNDLADGKAHEGQWMWNYSGKNTINYMDGKNKVGTFETADGLDGEDITKEVVSHIPNNYQLAYPKSMFKMGRAGMTQNVQVTPTQKASILNPGRPQISVKNTIVYKTSDGKKVGNTKEVTGYYGEAVPANDISAPNGYTLANPNKKYTLGTNGSEIDVLVNSVPVTPNNPVTPNKPSNPNNPATHSQNGNNGAQGNRNVKGNDGVQKRSKVYAMKAINLYKHSNLTGKIKHYKKVKRTNRPRFIVKKIVRTSHGTARYYVKQLNVHRYGWISGNMKLVQNNYYQPRSKAVRFRVLNHKGINSYKTLTLHHKDRHYRFDSVIKARRVLKDGLQTRFQLPNGKYVSARKNFVIYKH